MTLQEILSVSTYFPAKHSWELIAAVYEVSSATDDAENVLDIWIAKDRRGHENDRKTLQIYIHAMLKELSHLSILVLNICFDLQTAYCAVTIRIFKGHIQGQTCL